MVLLVSGWLQADGRPNRALETGLGRRASFQTFLPWRVSWPVVGVRMRLARLGRETEGLVERKEEGKGGRERERESERGRRGTRAGD